MSTLRQVLLLGGLTTALAIRWLDPLGKPIDDTPPASAAVEPPAKGRVTVTAPSSTPSDAQASQAWPARIAVEARKDGDLFASRSAMEAQALAAKKPPPPPPPPPYVPPPPPPPPPPPQEPAPTVQVIGTWGTEPDISVFLATPRGTLQVKTGDIVMSDYQVQSVSKQQLILLNQRTSKTWQFAVPEAPSALKTWPGR